MNIKGIYASFSAKDIAAVKDFYTNMPGIEIEKDFSPDGIVLKGFGQRFMIYQKDDHLPATYTVLNFSVDDLAHAMEKLKEKGISFERYADITGDDDIARFEDKMRMAWFKDPAGNILGLTDTM